MGMITYFTNEITIVKKVQPPTFYPAHKSNNQKFNMKPKKKYNVFIHSKLDKAGLNTSEFRVLCHVARRGECFETVKSISKHCRITEPTVRRSLQSLTNQRFLIREQRTGRTTLYEVAPMEHWKPAKPLLKERTGSDGKPTPSKTTPHYPYALKGVKVNPSEVHPHKSIPLSSSKADDLAGIYGFERPSREEFEELIEDECPLIAEYRTDLFDELEGKEWATSNGPIRDWRKCITGFEAKMEADYPKVDRKTPKRMTSRPPNPDEEVPF
jgi:hypothetical protein